MIINLICLAGTGRAAKELSIQALNEITYTNNRRRSVIKAVADIDESIANIICEMNKANNSYTNVQLMLEKAKPDILIINSPVSSHFECAMLAIDMNINYILEKPATATVKELEEIYDSTQKKV
jgi:predicted dehydrogenase